MTLNSLRAIGFDADDTLWVNETLFRDTERRFLELLSKYSDADRLEERLLDTERENLKHFGYGVKGFLLSMIETALALSGDRFSPRDIKMLIGWGKAMLAHPIELIEGVREVLDRLKSHFTLILITKGDLFDQENKLARSGLADYFDFVEIVSHKTPRVYQRILERHNWKPQEFIMAGNSLLSDVFPVIEIGSNAVHIPFHTTWKLELLDPSKIDKQRYFELRRISALPDLLRL